MLTDKDLLYMRQTLNETLPDTCNLLTVTLTSDGQGGYTEAWGTAVSSVACRLDYKVGDERVFGSSVKPYTGWMVTLPYDKTATNEYRIEVGSTTYSVEAVDNNKSWDAVLRCKVNEL